MFTITVTDKEGEVRHERFVQNEVSIGRAPQNDIVLAKENISQTHARVLEKNGAFNIVDNNSTNGTFINGRRIVEPYTMHLDDKIIIGDFVLKVSPGRAQAAAPQNPRASMPAEATTQTPLHSSGSVQAPEDEDWEEATNIQRKQSPVPAPKPPVKQADQPGMKTIRNLPSGMLDMLKKAAPPPASSPTHSSGIEDDWDMSDPSFDASPARHAAPATNVAPTTKAAQKTAPTAIATAEPATQLAYELATCLRRYVEIDENHRLRSYGQPCLCGKCLLCTAKELLNEL